MAIIGQHLSLRLFLEGIEVPVISANIQCQKNAAAMCSIQIPANDYAMDFHPRTLVHLFFKDLYNGAPAEEMVAVGGPGINVQEREQGVDPELEGLFPPERFASTPDQNQVDLENENYRLLFGGEIVGLGFSKQPTSRSIVLKCLDWSSYWDIAYQYQVSGMSLGGGGVRAAFTGASTSLFNSFLDGSGDIITRLMRTPPRSYPSLRNTLLGGIVHIIEAIGGVYYGRRAVRGVNDFFSLAEMRLHITQMIGANPFRQNAEQRLLRARGFGSLFRRSLSGLGKLVSIRQVLMALQRFIFHEHVPIVTPRYIPPLHDPALPNYETVGIEEDEDTRDLARVARRLKARAEELVQRQERSTDDNAARRQSDRRGGLRPELRQLIRLSNTAVRQAGLVGAQRGGGASADFFTIPEIRRIFATSAQRFGMVLEATRRGQRPGVRTYTFYPPDSRSAQQVAQMCGAIAEDMQGVLESRHRRRVQTRSSQPDPPARLITQAYRPDIWMVAPPRCNVIFPELYSQFNYGRDFNREVTRLMLRTHEAMYGSDILFDGFYMAPSRVLGQRRGRPITRGRDPRNPNQADAPIHVVRDLMEHELFSGIIPSFERMSDLNLHALRGGSTVGANGVRVGYAQFAANHIFFQYRFKSRQLACSGKFNPYIAFGFPCVIIDKWLPEEQLRTGTYNAAVAARIAATVVEGEGDVGGPPSEEQAELRAENRARAREVMVDIIAARPNTHYLGTPETMSHSVSIRSGGTTSMQMNYARTTNERTEFLGDNTGRPRRTRRVRNQTIHIEVGALEAPTVGTRGPRGGEITAVEDITDRYTRRQGRLASTNRTATGQRRYRGGTRLPLYTANQRFTRRYRRGTTVLVGVEQAAASYGAEVVALVGTIGRTQSSTADASETLVTFTAYRITEEVGVYAQEFTNLPPEELVFPPWYGDDYKSQNIGGIYSYLFGTGSLTDALTITGTRASARSQPQDGGTIDGLAPAQERSVRVAVMQRFGSVAAGSGAEPPTPEFNALMDELIGDRGDPAPADEGLGEVQGRGPIAEALEEVVRAYSLVKLNQFDVYEFIKGYTWRPVATMVDLFGTANLEITDDGEVVRGREGFHSRAFGDFDDLRQLVGQGDGNRPATVLGLTTRDPDEGGDDDRAQRDQVIAARLDTRKEKRLQVFRYLHALLNSSGVLG